MDQDLFDREDDTALDAKIAAILAEPVDLLSDRKKVLDEVIADLENPALQITSSGIPHTMETNYRDIFLTPGEDVMPLDEILQDSEAQGEARTFDLEGSTAEATIHTSSDSAAGGSFSAEGLAAGAAILAGAGAAIAAKLSSKNAAEPMEKLWHYSLDGQQQGPYSESDLREQLRSGQLSSQGYVWREGLSEWISVGEAGLLGQPQQAVQQPSPDQSPAIQPTGEQTWLYIDANHQQVGPITQSQLKALLTANTIRPDCLVWTEGMAEWQSAAAVGLAVVAVTQQDNVRCPGCGKELAPGSKFCGGCGTKIGAAAPSSQVAAPSQSNCPRCQAELKPNARFCGKCGHQL